MAMMESSTSVLFHGNSLTGPKGSKWLEKNIQEMDQSIKQMLKLIEEDGDSLTNSAGIYRQRKPELIANVEGFHEMYLSLAKYYDHSTKESCKNCTNIQLPGAGSSEFCSDQDSLLQTPDGRLDLHKSGFEVVGLDTSPKCDTTGSTRSSKEGNDLSSSSSDSESECFNTPAYSHFSTPLNSDGKVLHQKVIEIETELPSLEETLLTREADLELEKRRVLELQKDYDQLEANVSEADYRNGMLMEELKVTRERLRGSEEEIEKLRHELSYENFEGVLQLQGQLEVARERIFRLEAQLDSERRQVLELQERIETYNADSLDRDLEVRELRVALSNAQEQYTHEKTQLWSDVLGLSEKNTLLGTKFEELELRSQRLEDIVELCEKEKIELEKMHIEKEVALQGEISQLKVELTERREHLEILNKDFDRFKLKYDMLMAEKDELSAKVQMLMVNVSSRDDQVKQMEERLNQLHKRHEELIAESATAHKLENELKLRVEKLQKEVDRQRVEISDCAEEKREAIRQLCFSIEHYRSGYQELRQSIVVHKRQAVIAK